MFRRRVFNDIDATFQYSANTVLWPLLDTLLPERLISRR
jgi:hypothetical protein